ncbi:MAG: energy transducer TonB, partial [Alistipes sp.]|nr:energy transducer TonB [Alistipes sp.]
KWGWVDVRGNVVIPLIYDDNDAIYDESGDNSYYFWSDDWICLVWKDGKCGGINSKGEVVIPIIYDPEDVERTEDNEMILFNDPMYYYYSASGELLKTEERVAPIVNHKADIEVLEDVLTIVSNDTKIEVPQALYVEELTFDTIVFDVKPEEVVDTIVEEEVLFTVEEMPTYQGGDLSKFRNWVQSNVKYPQIAMENGIQGNVVVKFIIEKDGTLSNVQVLQSPDQALSDAVIQVLRKSPKWKPGKQRNKPVRVTFTLPVAFKLLQ